MQPATADPDVAIVGGGPAGLALAGILERAGMSYIVYERSARDHAPAGGCLDLHVGSGQRAMNEAGCFEQMRQYGRLGDATIHWVWDHHGNKLSCWGEGRDAPELDRTQIKAALLTTVPGEKIVWEKKVKATSRNEKGQVVLSFEDGTTATGFKLVVGADGTWSKVRPLITSATPHYAGVTFLTGKISPSNPLYSTVEKNAGQGPQVVMGRSTKIWNQRQGDGHYRVDLGFQRPRDFTTDGLFDLSDTDSVKKTMLQEDFFGCHAPEFKDMIKACEGPFRAWPLWLMPPDRLNWAPVEGVTLIGDAAHTTTPFVGDGVNCAMRDSVILAQKLKKYGLTHEAIAEYEKEMFPYAIDVIERSVASGELFFDWNSPKTFFEAMAVRPLIGTTDDY